MLSNALMQNAAFWCVCPAYTTITTTARNYAKSLQRPDKPSRHSHPVPKYCTTNDTIPYGPDAALHSRGRFLFLNFLIWGLLHLQYKPGHWQYKPGHMRSHTNQASPMLVWFPN